MTKYIPLTDDSEVLELGDEYRFDGLWNAVFDVGQTIHKFRNGFLCFEFRRPISDLGGERMKDQQYDSSTSQRIEYFCNQLKKTLLAKNADYGDSATKAPHLAPHTSAREAIEVRLSDKISRWRKLRLEGKAEVKESIEDTVLDTAGYCILWLCCVDETSIPGEQSTDN